MMVVSPASKRAILGLSLTVFNFKGCDGLEINVHDVTGLPGETWRMINVQ